MKRINLYQTLIILLAFVFIGGQSSHAVEDELKLKLQEVLADSPSTALGFVDLQALPETVNKALRKTYQANDDYPYWVTEHGPGQKAGALVSVLEAADEDGLDPGHYRLQRIKELWHSTHLHERALLDVALTLALGNYVTDMREGQAVACLLDPKLFAAARDKKVDISQVVHQALSAPDIVRFLHNQAPQHHGYQSLKKVLARYKDLEKQGGWQAIPSGKVLKPGMSDDRLDLIVKRLSITGDLPESLGPVETYEGPVVEAVKHFQKRYNLEQDGIIGKATLAALNIPVQDHIRRIILNMERWRWLPHTLNGQRLLVNIAGFQLAGIQDEQREISMPVIVGKVYHETPVFSHTMRYIEINPFWNIPQSIAVNEIVPKMRKDPDYLRKKHIRILSGWQNNASEINPSTIDWQTIGKGIKQYRLRQDPGPDNSLGTIKFMFPNRNNVYLHDTPAHSLFKKNKRSFSHGCIRVSNPRELAVYLLKKDGKDWSKEHIDSLIAKGKRMIIPLKNPFPVHILYRTVFVDPADGTVLFFDDIYGRDTLLAKALFTKGQPAQCRYKVH
ncbi:MAG: hypothetical protein DSY70_04295 [Desulfobulbus sp.]|nr:MAG: hypothetical protein DSY70_04295 [Desulfobulbus sp.]